MIYYTLQAKFSVAGTHQEGTEISIEPFQQEMTTPYDFYFNIFQGLLFHYGISFYLLVPSLQVHLKFCSCFSLFPLIYSSLIFFLVAMQLSSKMNKTSSPCIALGRKKKFFKCFQFWLSGIIPVFKLTVNLLYFFFLKEWNIAIFFLKLEYPSKYEYRRH